MDATQWFSTLDLPFDLPINEFFYQNLVVIGVELVALIIGYIVLSISLGFISRRIDQFVPNEDVSTRIRGFLSVFRMLLRLVLVVALLAIIGMNGYLMFQGEDLKAYTLGWLRQVPADFWSSLGLAIVKVIGLVYLSRFLARKTQMILELLQQKAVNYKQLRSNDESVTLFFERLKKLNQTGIWLLVTYLAVSLLNFPDNLVNWVLIALKVYLIASVGLLLVTAMAAIVDSLDGLSKRYAESNDLLAFYQQLRHLIPLLRKSLEYIIYAAVATLILKQLDFIAHLAEYGPGVIQGIGLIFLGRVGIEIINLLIDRTYLHDRLTDSERQRNETIFPIVKSMLATLVYFIVIVLILRGIGFDPVPLLAGAGILGMVVGLGAQPLVNDVVSGFFIIFENTFHVGDLISVKDGNGVVEGIGLRTTRIRSKDGQLHIIRNGSLGTVVNFSEQYTNAVVTLGVEHTANLDEVYATLLKIGLEMENDRDDVLGKLVIDGIEDFNGAELMLRTTTRVKPGCNKPVERELRRRIRDRFEKAGIIIPFEKRYKLA